MPKYKFTLHSGLTYFAEDERELEKLSEDLCSAGFLVLQRTNIGYSDELKLVSLLERSVAMIEVAG